MSKPLDILKYHITGAIERGEKIAIEAVTMPRDSDGKLSTYTWPGGHPLFYINTHDCQALCPDCANRELCHFISGYEVNWEDERLYCDGCSKQIESAYGEDEVTNE